VNCRDAARLIDYFFDGELDGRVMRDAAMHISRCPDCESELQDRERNQALLADSINGELDEVDLSGIWTAIERELERSQTLRSRFSIPWRGMAFPGRSDRSGRSETRQQRRPHDDLDDRAESALGKSSRRDEHYGAADDRDDWSPAGTSAWNRPTWSRPRMWASTGRPLTLAGLAALAASVVVAVTFARRDPEPAPEVASAPAARPSSNQVHIESMDYTGKSVAMWSEPEDDTMVIWIDDDDSGIPRKP
jgi:hypothetical protein